MPVSSQPKKIFISCGELSGDLLAADLIQAMRHSLLLEVRGITGPNLRAQGVGSILDINQLNVMGISEVLFKAHDIYLYIESIVAALKKDPPDLIILVDFPGFHFRLAKALKVLQIPIVQYAAPKVWAWGKKRVKKLRDDFSLVLGILPFEEEFFLQQGVKYRYAGCPIVERVHAYQKAIPDRPSIEKGLTLGIFPGSRRGEVNRILPSQLEVARELSQRFPVSRLMISIAKSLDPEWVDGLLADHLSQWTLPQNKLPEVFIEKDDSLQAMRDSDFALVSSGTATLECALIGTPQVVMYKLSGLTHAIAKHFVKIEHVSLVNLIAGKTVVQEYIQDYDPTEVALDIKAMIMNTLQWQHLLDGYQQMRSKLDIPGKESAAAFACSIIKEEFFNKP